MTKRQIIENIRDINLNADPDFLFEFSEVELGEYLSHLKDIRKAVRTNFPTRIGSFYASDTEQARREHGIYISHKKEINVGHRQLALTL